jgi:hypothetical protein
MALIPGDLAFDFVGLSESAFGPSVDYEQFERLPVRSLRLGIRWLFLHASPYRPNVLLRNAKLELTFCCSLASLTA